MAITDLEFLSYKDFIDQQELQKDWTVVCGSIPVSAKFDENPEDFAIISFLAPHDDEVIKTILSDRSWRVDFFFGTVSFDIDYSTQEISLNNGKQTIYYDPEIEVEPFTIFRSFDGLFPENPEIIQEFILYHNLYFDTVNNRYIEPKIQESVIEFDGHKQIKIKTNYIRDFLAAKKMILVTCRDHTRQLKGKLSDFTSEKRIEIENTTQLHNHSVTVFDYPQQKCACSKLFAKDILTPLSEPQHRDYQMLKPDRKYEDFVVGIDEVSGLDISANCKQDGGMEFLQLAFFKKTVLDKYHGDSRLYTVESRVVYSLHEWYLPYGLNNAGLVHVHLGDLQYLPYSEQQYWKQFNIRPEGGMSEESFRADYMGEFVESTDPVTRFKNLRVKLNKKITEKFGFPLFKELIDADQYVKEQIHSLTSDNPGEFDKQLIFLTKLSVDSINYAELEKIVTWRPSPEQSGNKLGLLEHLLMEKDGMSESVAKSIIQPFRFAYELRSGSSAHRKSARRYSKIIEKQNLEGLTNDKKFDKIVDSINTAISLIHETDFKN